MRSSWTRSSLAISSGVPFRMTRVRGALSTASRSRVRLARSSWMIPMPEFKTRTRPNSASAGVPVTSTMTARAPRRPLKGVTTFARMTYRRGRLVSVPAELVRPRSTRSATSASVSPVGAVVVGLFSAGLIDCVGCGWDTLSKVPCALLRNPSHTDEVADRPGEHPPARLDRSEDLEAIPAKLGEQSVPGEARPNGSAGGDRHAGPVHPPDDLLERKQPARSQHPGHLGDSLTPRRFEMHGSEVDHGVVLVSGRFDGSHVANVDVRVISIAEAAAGLLDHDRVEIDAVNGRCAHYAFQKFHTHAPSAADLQHVLAGEVGAQALHGRHDH